MRERHLLESGIDRESLLTPIPTTKIIEIGVNEIHSINRVLQWLFEVFIFPKKPNLSQQ
jgi:hypothetical protein